MRVALAGPIDVRDFRTQANTLLARQVAPAEIAWDPLAELACGIAYRGDGVLASGAPSALHAIVPRSFVRLTQLVVLHRDPRRFDLLYRLLWRLVHEPELAATRGDADMALARSMAQAVRRDLAQARAAAVLRPLPPQEDVTLSIAWCDPHHQVTEHIAEWLVTQHPGPPWLLASPDRCVLWTGKHLLCGIGIPTLQSRLMHDADWYALASQLASRSA